MSATIENVNGVSVVTLAGDQLDASNVEELRADLDPVLATSKKVLLDLREIRFVDSSGLGAIVSVLKRLAANGGVLKISDVRPEVKSLFELVRLHKLCETFDTREQAVASFG